jgi:cobalt-zinc-cadmium resistance protein CzcA
VESIVNELQQKLTQQIKFAPGYSITYGGSFENLQAAKSRLSIAVPVALLLIFLLLYFAFNSIKQGLLIFTAIPLSAVGGILALWLRNMPFSISAGVGFIALFGVAVLNGIVLISECNRLQKEGMNNIDNIILTATSSRLRPIMITATVASLGFIPMALSTGSGAEVQRPLATVVIGGLITATILTLLVLPALYKTFTKIKQPPAAAVFIAFLLMLCSSGSLKAQTVSYTREQVIQAALANNKNLQAISLDVASQKSLRGTSSDIGKTNITLLYGQYNSLNSTDNNFTVLQTMPFPTVFSKKAALNDAMVQGKEYEWQFNSKQLEYNVKMAWNELLYTYALERLLMKQDSLFSAFQKAADLRYKTGETNLLEKTTVETQHNEIKNQLMQVLSNRKAIQYKLQGFMQITTPALIAPADTSWAILPLPNLADSSTFNRHPFALYWQQQIQIANANKKVYAAQKAPDITVGYFNQSLIGYQNVNGQDKYFDGSKRFDGLHAGLSIPLWIKPYQAKVKSAEIEAKAAEARYQSSVTVLQTQYQEAIQNYLKNKASLDYYISSALQNAALMTQQAQQAFQKGETDFVAYLLALNNALSIQQNYIQAILNYNNNIISIEYLLAQ